MKTQKFSKGFTLIELLIVITIIGILAVSLLPSVLGAPARARDAARISDLRNIETALEVYNSDKQGYPDSSFNGKCVDEITGIGAYFQGGQPPMDPQKKKADGTAVGGSCKSGYLYVSGDGNPVSYILVAHMEIAGDGKVKYSDISGSLGGTIDQAAITAINGKIQAPTGALDAYIEIK